MPAGWDLTGATCSDGATPASVGLDPGENVTCTFANTKLGSLVVVKRAVGGDDTFPFTSPPLGSFSLTTVTGTAQPSFTNLPPGSYDVSETVPAGWDADSGDPVCSNGEQRRHITVAPGETVTCTFQNTKQGPIVVKKQAVGGDGAFDFAAAG